MAIQLGQDEEQMADVTGMPVVFRDNPGAKPRAGIVSEGLVRADCGLPLFDGSGRIEITVFLPPSANDQRPVIQVDKTVKHRLDPTREPTLGDPGDPRFWDWTPSTKALIALGLGVGEPEAAVVEFAARLDNGEARAKALAGRLERAQDQIKELRAKLKGVAKQVDEQAPAVPAEVGA